MSTNANQLADGWTLSRRPAPGLSIMRTMPAPREPGGALSDAQRAGAEAPVRAHRAHDGTQHPPHLRHAGRIRPFRPAAPASRSRNDRRLNHPPSLPRASRRAAATDADARLGQAQGPDAATLATCTQRRMDRGRSLERAGPAERRSLVDGAIVGLLFHSTGGERFERRSERGGGEPAGWRCRFRSTAPGTPQGSSVHLPPAWRRTPPS